MSERKSDILDSITSDEFIRGYCDTMLWCNCIDAETGEQADTGSQGEELDECTIPCLRQMRRDARAFRQAVCNASESTPGMYAELEENPYRAGVDFALTRNRHGAGYWDGPWQHGAQLTELAHCEGEATLEMYRGRIHHM